MGIGSRVDVFAAGHLGEPAHRIGAQEIGTGFGYASGQPAMCHFGLGDAERVDVEVRLPNSAIVKLPNIKAGQVLTVEQP